MRELDFFQLPRPIQDRFIGAAQGGVPSPVMVARPRRWEPLAWYAAGAASFALTLGVARLGFGRLDSVAALQPAAWLPLYAAFAALSVFCVLRGSARAQRDRALPFRPWVYLFPVGIVDARKPKLRVYDITEVQSVEGSGARVSLRLGSGEVFVFDVGDARNAEVAKNAVEEAKRLYRHAEESQSRRDRAALDPLSDTGFSNPFSPKTPLRRLEPLPLIKSVPAAIVLGAAVGLSIWWLRNRASEERLYAAARQQDDDAGYRAYLARGGHRADVTEILLPRAELKVARQTGDPEAIRRFIEQHPNSKIAAEVATAHRAILLELLERARAQGTVTALDEFTRANPGSELVRPELTRARDQVYRRALEDFRKQASSSNPEVVAFFERLLAHAKTHGPKVLVRFQAKLSPSTSNIEQALQKHNHYMGTVSLPAQYFDARRARAREAVAAAVLIERLQAAFPPDVLKFELGEPVPDEQPLPEQVQVPTLFVQHTVQMNGLYLSRNPRGIYVGLGTLFHSSFRVPGDEEPFNLKFSQWRPPDTSLLEKEGGSVEAVYESSASEAFDKFTKRFLATVFEKPAKP